MTNSNGTNGTVVVPNKDNVNPVNRGQQDYDIMNLFENFIGIGLLQSPAIAAVRTLIHTIQNHDGSTVNQLVQEIKEAIRVVETIPGKSKLAVSSCCAQFLRYATLNLANIESAEMVVCKNRMEEEGKKYLTRCERSILKVAKSGAPFIFDGAKVLVHSNSQVVLESLKAVPENIQFSVWVTNSEKDLTVNQDFDYELQQCANINHQYIHDSEIGYIMETLDFVLVGAEAVVKNGGILNKVGTLSLAICAKEMNKPLYVLAESFKFSLIYPLNQRDIPSEFRFGENGRVRVDYTPPKYITMLITDRGLLTPTAVCDELVEMYV